MEKLIVSSSPHIHTKRTTQSIMLDVIIALVPAAIAGCVIFGWMALLTIGVCVGTCVLSEFLFNLICKKKQTVGDLSAIVTGLLLGLSLPVISAENLGTSIVQTIFTSVVGSVFAIIIVKCLFGGLGCNFANPAVTARVVLLLSFPVLSSGVTPNFSSNVDLVSGATPLPILAEGGELPSLLDMFLGLHKGAIGETCAAALILGFIYLVIRKVIKFETPLIFVGTVFLLSLACEGDLLFATYHVLSGGLLIAAIFMATDYVTTPITRLGRMIFAFGCGLITFLIRYFGGYPEGVSFAILFMNILSPYIEKWTKKIPLGGKKA